MAYAVIDQETLNPVYQAWIKRGEAIEALIKSKPEEYWAQVAKTQEQQYIAAYEAMGLPYYKWTNGYTIVTPPPPTPPPTVPAGAGILLILALFLLGK